MKFLIMQFSPTSCLFIPRSSKYFQEATTENVEMKFLRSVAGCTRNIDIEGRSEYLYSKIQMSLEVITSYELEDNRIPQIMLTCNPKRRQNIGRPWMLRGGGGYLTPHIKTQGCVGRKKKGSEALLCLY
jgi:hypothetical protein